MGSNPTTVRNDKMDIGRPPAQEVPLGSSTISMDWKTSDTKTENFVINLFCSKCGWPHRCVRSNCLQLHTHHLTVWPLTPKIDRTTWAFLKFDMRHRAYSDVRQGVKNDIIVTIDVAFS